MSTMKQSRTMFGGYNDDRGLDGPDESLSSFGLPVETAKPVVKYAWTNNDKARSTKLHI